MDNELAAAERRFFYGKAWLGDGVVAEEDVTHAIDFCLLLKIVLVLICDEEGQLETSTGRIVVQRVCLKAQPNLTIPCGSELWALKQLLILEILVDVFHPVRVLIQNAKTVVLHFIKLR